MSCTLDATLPADVDLVSTVGMYLRETREAVNYVYNNMWEDPGNIDGGWARTVYTLGQYINGGDS